VSLSPLLVARQSNAKSKNETTKSKKRKLKHEAKATRLKSEKFVVGDDVIVYCVAGGQPGHGWMQKLLLKLSTLR